MATEPTWAELWGGDHLAIETIYALHTAAQEPNWCLLVPRGGRLLLPQCLRRQREVKWKTAVAAALFSAPLSLHITQISPQTFPSPALFPLHITLLDPFFLDLSLCASLCPVQSGVNRKETKAHKLRHKGRKKNLHSPHIISMHSFPAL